MTPDHISQMMQDMRSGLTVLYVSNEYTINSIFTTIIEDWLQNDEAYKLSHPRYIKEADGFGSITFITSPSGRELHIDRVYCDGLVSDLERNHIEMCTRSSRALHPVVFLH